MLGRPCWLGTANLESEIAQDVRTRLRVVDLGMELHCPHFSLGSFDRGDRTRRTRYKMEAGREFDRFVSVGHPDGKFCGEAVEKAAAVLDFDIRTAVLA